MVGGYHGEPSAAVRMQKRTDTIEEVRRSRDFCDW
jgi:hypothetical protein